MFIISGVLSGTKFNIRAATGQSAGAVAISGVPLEDETLFANVSDSNGVSGLVNYQWQRSSNGVNGWAVIAGATGNSYTLSDIDVDGYLRVRATYTDGLGTYEDVTSSPTGQVVGVNDAPIAIQDPLVTTDEDTAVVINVLINDTDVDGVIDPTSVVITVAPTHGVTTVNPTTGVVTYEPDANYFGSDSFTYTVDDDEGTTSNPITVDITVASVNDVPTITYDDPLVTTEDTELAIDLLDTVEDVDGTVDSSGIALVSSPSNGSINLNTVTGVAVYTPSPNFNGSDSFSYTVEDNDGGVSLPVTVDIQVTAVNDSPIANADPVVNTNEDTAITFSVIGNDVDVDGTIDPTSVEITSSTANGVLNVNTTSGAISYFPFNNFNGTDSFTYTVEDNTGAVSNPVSVTINVIPVNDDPTANADPTVFVDENTSVNIDVISNDTDIDGTIDPTSVNITSDVENGSLSVNASSGLITYTPDTNYKGSDSFTYTVNDNQGGTSNAIAVNISVLAVNTPGAVSIIGTPQEDQQLQAVVSDPDGVDTISSHQWQVSENGSSGWVNLNFTNNPVYTVTQFSVGKYLRVRVIYTDSEGNLSTIFSPSTPQIVNVNDVGVLTISGTELEGQTLSLSLSDNDGLSSVSYFWQFSSNGVSGWSNISGANGTTYTLQSIDVGDYIRARAVYTDNEGTPENIYSSPTGVILSDNQQGTVTLSGSFVEDQTVTASVSDPDGISGGVSWQWQKSSTGTGGWFNLSGAIVPFFDLTDSEVGDYLRVRASYTDSEGNVSAINSVSSPQVVNINDVGTLTLVGNPEQGETLDATSLTDGDGFTTVSRSWQRSPTGSGSWSYTGDGGSYYILDQADVNQYIRCRAVYTDSHGTSEEVFSNAIGPIAGANTIGQVSISGDLVEEETLTATATDPQGIVGSVNYQWQRSNDGLNGWQTLSGSQIEGNSFYVSPFSVGKFIRVRALYTDGIGTSEDVYSGVVGPIEAANNLGEILISGDFEVGATLTAQVTDEDGISGAISYQWYSSDTLNGNYAFLGGEDQQTIFIEESDEGNYFRVTAQYTDDLGNSESLTSFNVGPMISTNEAPVAVFDGTTLVVRDLPSKFSIIDNDTDSDGTIDTTSVSIVTPPSNGSVVVNSTTGEIEYTPDAGYLGSDSFSYTVDDNEGATSNTSNVLLDVRPPWVGPEQTDSFWYGTSDNLSVWSVTPATPPSTGDATGSWINHPDASNLYGDAVIGATSPVINMGVLNGDSAAYYAGTSSHIVENVLIDTSDGFSVAMVFKVDAATSGVLLDIPYTGSTGSWLKVSYSNNVILLECEFPGGTPVDDANISFNPSDWVIFVFSIDMSGPVAETPEAVVGINGAYTNTVVPPRPAFPDTEFSTDIIFGNSVSGAEPASADYVEAYCGEPLAGADTTRFTAYAAHKYGRTDLLPNGHPFKNIAPIA